MHTTHAGRLLAACALVCLSAAGLSGLSTPAAADSCAYASVGPDGVWAVAVSGGHEHGHSWGHGHGWGYGHGWGHGHGHGWGYWPCPPCPPEPPTPPPT
ncbi:hypothetical protein LCE31_25475, partial [Streptomyces sp. 8L]|nr:hypothetical protein [Streptomyces sp. 8L]